MRHFSFSLLAVLALAGAAQVAAAADSAGAHVTVRAHRIKPAGGTERLESWVGIVPPGEQRITIGRGGEEPPLPIALAYDPEADSLRVTFLEPPYAMTAALEVTVTSDTKQQTTRIVLEESP